MPSDADAVPEDPVSRQRLFEVAIWVFTLFCIAMMFAGPLSELSRQLGAAVESIP